MSRPRWSVPNQCMAEGACSRSVGVMNCGSPAIHGAIAATIAMAISNALPIAMVGLRRTKTRKRARRPGSASGMSTVVVISVADAWIEEGIAEIDQQIDQHVDAGEHQYDALDDRIVAPRDRIDDEPADA